MLVDCRKLEWIRYNINGNGFTVNKKWFCRGVVKHEPLLFFSEALQLVYERVCALLLSDLSYSPNLALTLLSARMRERKHAHAHTRVTEIQKKSWRLILHDVRFAGDCCNCPKENFSGYQWSRHTMISSQRFRHKVRVRARQLWG